MNDLKFALRQLLKQPGFTVIAVLILGVGIGANTIVYSWIDTILLNSIPGARNAHELVAVVPASPQGTSEWMSYPDTRDLAEQTTTLEGVTGSDMAMMRVRSGEVSEWVWGQVVMANFFRVLEVGLALGRVDFPGADADVGNAPHVVVSHRYWQTNLGGNPDVVGREISINDQPFSIIGVAAKGFKGSVGGLSFDIWVPLAMGETIGVTPGLTDDKRGWHWLSVLGRLKSGVSRKSAQAEVAILARHIASKNSDAGPDDGVALLPLWNSPEGGQKIFLPLLRALLVVALLVLALVVATIANLLLARATVRNREIGVRLAIGAGRFRVIRLLIAESMLLTGLGCAVGIGLAHLGTGLLASFIPVSHLPSGYDVQISWPVIVLASGVATLAGLIFGLAPAWSLVRQPLAKLMGETARGSESRGSGQLLRRILVVGQFAIAMMVLIAAGLCMRSFHNANKLDLGFNPDGVWVAGFKLDAVGYDGPAAANFYQRLEERLRALPEVTAVAFTDYLPLGYEEGGGGGITLSGYEPRPGEQMSAGLCRVMPGYFETLQIPLVTGRDIRSDDGAESRMIAVINQTMADRYFADRSPIGQTVQLWGADRTIVGVVGDLKSRELNEPPANLVFVPQMQLGPMNLLAVVRSSGNPDLIGNVISTIARDLDPGVTVWHSISFNDYVQPAFLLPRVAASLLSALGFLAVALAAMGLYAVIAFNVVRRTRELGIRLALGSSREEIMSLMLGQGIRLAGCGLAVGLIAGYGTSRMLRSILLQVEPFDPGTFLIAATVLLGTAVVACWLPARRAARVDPMVALRSE